jgi:magnesium-transporting ATPase (P-type)
MGQNSKQQHLVAIIALAGLVVVSSFQPSRNLARVFRRANPSRFSSGACRLIERKQPTQFTTLFSAQSETDPLVYRASKNLTASSWLSWWSQVILTVISAVTFIFARNVMEASSITLGMGLGTVAPKFVLPGLSTILSTMSIIWTWGGRRLSKRFLRRTNTTPVGAANLLRRMIKVGAAINLMGLFTSVLGAQFIIGTLVAKSMQNVVGVGIAGGISAQTLQPLDVLVVQANTNMLTSHFISLACLLWLTRMVDKLDPPSLEDDV